MTTATSNWIRQISAGVLLAACLQAAPAAAFDSSQVKSGSDPWSVFRFGFNAYRSGDKKEAVEAYRYAAEKGHAGT